MGFTKRVCRGVAALAVITLGACEGAPVSPVDVPIPTPSGVVVVGTTESPIGAVRIFGRHLDGYFLLDGQNHRVLLVDARGRVRRVIGRRGGGPGEFLNPSRVSAARDGRLVVFDPPVVTVFDSLGEIRHRFETPLPFPAGVEWVCDDSLIAHAGYGDVSGRAPVPVVELYREDGARAGESRSWPRWTDSMNNSLSGLAFSERDCELTLVENVGRYIGRIQVRDGAEVEAHREIPWWTNAAEVLALYYNERGIPESSGALVWVNQAIWHIDGDTVLVRQDSIAADRGVLSRYELIAGNARARSAHSEIAIREIFADSLVFARTLDDGSLEIGTAALADLLEPLRAAMGPALSEPN